MLILIFHHCWSKEKRYHQFCSAGKWMQIFEKIGVAIYYWYWHWYWLLTFTKEYRYYQCKILCRGKSVQLIFEAIAYIERSNEMAIKELGQHMCPMLLGHFTVCTLHTVRCTTMSDCTTTAPLPAGHCVTISAVSFVIWSREDWNGCTEDENIQSSFSQWLHYIA